jgi:hypothetical protein
MKRKVAAMLLWLISLMISRIKRIKTIIKDAMKISSHISWVLFNAKLIEDDFVQSFNRKPGLPVWHKAKANMLAKLFYLLCGC